MASIARKAGVTVLWVVSILGALPMLLVGWGKVAGNSPWPRFFEEFGYPGWFRIAVGLAQIIGGIAVLVPRVAHYGAALLTGVMAGAVVTELTREGGFPTPRAALMYTLIFATVFVVRFRTRPRQMETGS